MYTLWLVAEDPSLVETLAVYLRALGDVRTGPLEARSWRDQDAPDLVALVGADPGAVPGGEAAVLERLLAFLRGVPHPRRAPPPVLYLEPPSGRPSGAVLGPLVDDRAFEALGWPLDPDRLEDRAGALLSGRSTPPSLRERARREWVTRRVELLYAELDLPDLRQAVDPRNAARPILLAGEPGSHRGLLARYIHNLAEPPRDELIALPVTGLRPFEVETQVLDRARGARATVYLQAIDRADPVVQEALAQLLAESGALGVEPLRWIASCGPRSRLEPALRQLGWLRVGLPAVRQRPDRAELIRALTRDWAERNRRTVELDDSALEMLARSPWPGNLRELESVLERSLSACPGDRLAAAGVRLADAPAVPPEEPVAPAEVEPAGAEPEEDLDEADVIDLGVEEPPPVEASPPSADLRDAITPLAEEIRRPLLAVRTLASLLEQRPDDAEVRHKLAALLEGDLARVEALVHRLEEFAGFGAPRIAPVDLPALVAAELDARQSEIRARSLVVLKELDHAAPPARADEKLIRFAIGALLDRALRMMPSGSDLYVASLHRPQREGGAPAQHRLLVRFHSPEDVLVRPTDMPGPAVPIEVVLARALVERMGGHFAVDASGQQDNVILIELPAT